MRVDGRDGSRVALAAVALTLLTTALTAVTPAPPTGVPQPARAPAPVLAALDPRAPVPTPSALARALAVPLTDPGLGGDPHVEVVDASSGKVLLDHLGTVRTIPASTEKLLTAAAALLVLGPRARLTTRVFAAGSDLYLVGGGDPILSAAPATQGYPAPADLTSLARSVVARHPTPTAQVIGVGNAYGGPDLAPGWSPSYLSEGDVAAVRSLSVDEAKVTAAVAPGIRQQNPVIAAATSFRAALSAAGAKFGSAPVGELTMGALPKGARLIASVSSPPVSALIERMLNYSDADIAEGLGRQVALHSGLPATFAGVAAAVTKVAHTLGLPAAPVIMDGSGLSRANSVAPITLTTLLRDAAVGGAPRLQPLIAALAIAGFTGTLATRFTGAAAAGDGLVRAKTGWLNGAAGLAGLVTTADGRLLIFAALAPATYRYVGESALDRIAATLARCGCR